MGIPQKPLAGGSASERAEIDLKAPGQTCLALFAARVLSQKKEGRAMGENSKI